MPIGNVAYEADEAAPDYAVPAAVSATQGILSELESNLSRLRERLSPVVVVRPEGKGEAKLRSSSCVPLADQLDTISSRIGYANELLLDLLDRLHVYPHAGRSASAGFHGTGMCAGDALNHLKPWE